MPAKLTVTLETVTPLFLAGADPRGAPELRAPSFRGALRYWLRAALGGVLGDDVTAVRKAEAAVFGSTDEGMGGASAVSVRIRHSALPPPVVFPQLARPPSGRDYLYWSMAASGRIERNNYLPAKQYLPPGSRFDLTFAVRPGSSNHSDALKCASSALWLLIHLGGVGSRSRRTAGSLRVHGDVEFQGLRFTLRGGNAQEIAQALADGLRQVREICASASGGNTGCAVQSPTSFDVLHPTTCMVRVLGMWPSADAAVHAIGNWLREARSALPLARRTVFGLPMQRVELSGVDRRASPLWLTVIPVTNGEWAGIATLFRSRLFPTGTTIRVNNASQSLPTNYSEIEAALVEWMRRSPSGVEVSYD